VVIDGPARETREASQYARDHVADDHFGRRNISSRKPRGDHRDEAAVWAHARVAVAQRVRVGREVAYELGLARDAIESEDVRLTVGVGGDKLIGRAGKDDVAAIAGEHGWLDAGVHGTAVVGSGDDAVVEAGRRFDEQRAGRQPAGDDNGRSSQREPSNNRHCEPGAP